MMNKYGLSRDIPAPVKRQVRQSCGFGCVLCGGSIVEYEHFDPPFAGAHSHEAGGITLLCPTCHAKSTRGYLSRDTVLDGVRDPFCLRSGFTSEVFDMGPGHPIVIFAGVTLRSCPVPIEVKGTSLFKIEAPEVERGPFKLSATFHNATGHPSLIIVENEWQALTANWDVETTGGVITIRDAPSQISLRLVALPRVGIRVDRLDMRIADYHLVGDRDTLVVNSPTIRNASFSRCILDGAQVGLSLG